MEMAGSTGQMAENILVSFTKIKSKATVNSGGEMVDFMMATGREERCTASVFTKNTLELL